MIQSMSDTAPSTSSQVSYYSKSSIVDTVLRELEPHADDVEVSSSQARYSGPIRGLAVSTVTPDGFCRVVTTC